MLKLTIPPRELWDEKNEQFIHIKGATLTLEHSLVSISKWEARWKKPFLGSAAKTKEESLDYVRCMTLTQNVDPDIYRNLDNRSMDLVNRYISENQTATWFSDKTGKKNSKKKTITSEVIYGWMVSLNIPFECQKWHLSRLLTLIHVCDVNNSSSNKLDKKQSALQRNALNAKRRKAHHSKG